MPQIAYFSPFGLYKGKWAKNVIFHDFFKLLQNVLRWYCRYVEMFLGLPEGILSPRTHFWSILRSQQTKTFCFKIAYFGSFGLYKGKWAKNVIFHDFFKLLLNVPRYYPRYVEMFLGPLEDVLSLRTYFWPVSKLHVKWTFSPKSCH